MFFASLMDVLGRGYCGIKNTNTKVQKTTLGSIRHHDSSEEWKRTDSWKLTHRVVGCESRQAFKKTCWRTQASPERTQSKGARNENSMMKTPLLVSVVDDDESIRESLPDLLKELGFAARAFSSAEAFLASEVLSETKCLILDIAMPGMSGPELQNELERLRIQIPIIFITAHGDEAVRSRVLEEGAIKCLPKPFSDTALLQALNAALNGK